MEKITFEQLEKDYFNGEVCMGELLADTPATGLTIEEAFYLYILAMSRLENDEFKTYRDGEYVDLVREAKTMEL